MGEENNYWIIELYNDETANVSIMSKEEADAMKKTSRNGRWNHAARSQKKT